MIPEDAFPLQTQRLFLRPVTVSDTGALYELYADWEVARWLSRLPWPFTRSAAQSLVVDATDQFTRGSGCLLAMVEHETSAFVGLSVCAYPRWNRMRGQPIRSSGFWATRLCDTVGAVALPAKAQHVQRHSRSATWAWHDSGQQPCARISPRVEPWSDWASPSRSSVSKRCPPMVGRLVSAMSTC